MISCRQCDNVKGITHTDERTENHLLNLRRPLGFMDLYNEFQLIV